MTDTDLEEDMDTNEKEIEDLSPIFSMAVDAVESAAEEYDASEMDVGLKGVISAYRSGDVQKEDLLVLLDPFFILHPMLRIKFLSCFPPDVRMKLIDSSSDDGLGSRSLSEDDMLSFETQSSPDEMIVPYRDYSKQVTVTPKKECSTMEGSNDPSGTDTQTQNSEVTSTTEQLEDSSKRRATTIEESKDLEETMTYFKRKRTHSEEDNSHKDESKASSEQRATAAVGVEGWMECLEERTITPKDAASTVEDSKNHSEMGTLTPKEHNSKEGSKLRTTTSPENDVSKKEPKDTS